MKNESWLFKTSLKYLFTRKSALSIIIISIIGITLGVAVLILVMSIMNGSQLIFYENSQEIMSYHLQITANDSYEETLSFANKIKNEIPEVFSSSIYFEFQGLMMNNRGKQFFSMLRGVPVNILEQDTRMAHFLTNYHQGEMKTGHFNLTKKNNIVLGSDIARALSVTSGSKIQFYSLNSGLATSNEDLHFNFDVAGVYETEWNAGVDSILSFVPIELYPDIANGVPYHIGIKLHHSKRDHFVENQIRKLGLPEGWKLSSWRDYNRSFFSALRMEKTTMSLLVLLIFIVFAVNTYNGLSRLIFDKQEELGMLRAIGATPMQVRFIFIFQGFFIALLGVCIGDLIGLFVTQNLAEIRAFCIEAKDWIVTLFNPQYYNPYRWSQSNFAEPRILFNDLLLIDLLAVGISTFAAFIASFKIGKIKPAEVLKDE